MHKLSLLLAALLPFCFLYAQNKTVHIDDIYPRPKPMSIPRDLSSSPANAAAFFSAGLTCASGDCNNGSGTCFCMKDAKWNDAICTVPVIIWKGNFRKDGQDFEGKKYRVDLKYKWVQAGNYKKIEPVEDADLMDENFLQQHIECTGSFTRTAIAYSLDFKRNFIYQPLVLDDDPFARKALSNAVSAKVWYEQNIPVRIAVSFNATNGLLHFSGFCNADYTPALGTAQYHGDTSYTGFFLQNNPFGAGILMPKNGKTSSGFFDDEGYMRPADISFPEFISHPEMPVSGGKSFTVSMDINMQGVLWGEGGGLFHSEKDWYYFNTVSEHIPVAGVGSYLQLVGPDSTYTSSAGDIKEYLFTGLFKNGRLGEGAQGRQTFKLREERTYNGEMPHYRSLLANIYTGNRDDAGKKIGCIRVKQIVPKGGGSFILDVPYENNAAVNPCWGRVIFSDNIHLSRGLVFLDDEKSFTEVMHMDRDPVHNDFLLAVLTPVKCNPGAAQEKQDYLTKLSDKISETEKSRAAYAKQQADDKVKREADASRAAADYAAAHPEIAANKQALDASRETWARLGLSSGAGLGHNDGSQCVFDERFVESYNDQTGMVTIRYAKSNTKTDYFGIKTTLIQETVPASSLASACFTGYYYTLCPRCHGVPVATTETMVNAYQGNDGKMHGDLVKGVDKCERCRLHGYVPIRQHGEPGFW